MRFLFDQDMNVTVYLNQNVGMSEKGSQFTLASSEEVMINGGEEGDMTGGDMAGGEFTETKVKDPLLSNLPFVIGVSLGVILLGLIAGYLLAKRKIKNGFELYED